MGELRELTEHIIEWKIELQRADVDVDGAIQRFANKEERYVKYLKLFKNNSSFHNLTIALENSECEEAFECCHSLKGVVGNLGFRTLYPTICEACEILRGGSMEGVSDMINSIEDNYNEIIRIITKYLI